MNAEQQLWEIIRGNIELKISASQFSMFFQKPSIIELVGEKVIIDGYNVFIKKGLNKYLNDIIEILKDNGYQNPEIEIILDTKQKTAPKHSDQVFKPSSAINNPEINTNINKNKISDGLNPKFTFNNYVIGSNNDLAVSVAKAVAENPGKKANPFYIFGKPGIGKTHLIEAVGNKIKENHPDYRVLYITSETFMNDFINFSGRKTTTSSDFHKKYEKIDVLIIDDIQFLSDKEKAEKTKDQLFHTFETLYGKEKQIIVASDRAPADMTGFADRFTSRLGMAGTYDITLPNFESRYAFIKLKANEKSIQIDNNVIEFIAENIKTNMREIEGILTKIFAMSEFQNVPITIDLVKSQIENLSKEKAATHHITHRMVIHKVANYFGIKPDEIKGPSRAAHIATARHICVYFMNVRLNTPLKNAAREVGRDDHTTAKNSVNKITKLLLIDIKLREQINEIEELLYA